ncbi:MAG: single-stranded DNA-binding protein [Erysipelotrichales bacterium]|nr:single-stranded DNA-binding protein [Erysipelotrichales bacterium]
MNRVVLVGRITKDPEVKMMNVDAAVCNFTVAINRPYTNDKGERQADFINCVVWRKQAENLGRFVRKGMLIGVEGRIQTRSFETDGQMRYVTEVLCDTVQFLESKSDESRGEYQAPSYDAPVLNPSHFEKSVQTNNKEEEDKYFESSKKIAVTEEDLPF